MMTALIKGLIDVLANAYKEWGKPEVHTCPSCHRDFTLVIVPGVSITHVPAIGGCEDCQTW